MCKNNTVIYISMKVLHTKLSSEVLDFQKMGGFGIAEKGRNPPKGCIDYKKVPVIFTH